MKTQVLSRLLSIGLLMALGCASTGGVPAMRDPDNRQNPFAASTGDLSYRPGLLDMYVDELANRVLLVLPAPDETGLVGSYLYLEGLTTGLGSNPIGLDRGQLGGSRGWAARRAPTRRLAQTEQGAYRLDMARSAVDTAACLSFPDNLEFEAVLTWEGEPKGDLVRQTAPTPEAITLVQHHSLVRLPDPGYTPRRFDPRMGSFEISFLDYAAPLDEPLRRQWIVRHRLERTEPAASKACAHHEAPSTSADRMGSGTPRST